MGVRRWLALCGVFAAIILAVGAIGRSDAPSEVNLSPQVQIYYRTNGALHQIGAAALLLAAVLLVLFGARLWGLLGSGDGDGRLMAIATFGGAVLAAATVAAAAVAHLALVDAAHNRLSIAVRTLNLLDHYAILAVGVGLAAMFLAAGIAIVRTPVLPRGLGWAAIVIAALAVAGPVGVAGIVAGSIWMLFVASLLVIKGTVEAEVAA